MRAVLLIGLFSLSAFATLASSPAEPPAELPAVAVQGESTARREYKTVADLLSVLDVFEREKGRYAPAAELRIRVQPRRDLADVPELELRHGMVRDPIALDALGRFTVPPAWRTLPADATVRSRLLNGRLAWMVDVRTPGVAEGSRRLGDLRLGWLHNWLGGFGGCAVNGVLAGGFFYCFFAVEFIPTKHDIPRFLTCVRLGIVTIDVAPKVLWCAG